MTRRPRSSVGLLVLFLAGCQAAPGPVFPAVFPARVWPPPPDLPRIRWVGELRGEASLGARLSGGAALRALVVGAPAKAAFSTPTAVAVVGECVFVSDGQLRAVHVLELESRKYRAIGQVGGRALEWPIDVAWGDGVLAIADSQAGRVALVSADGAARGELAGPLKRPSAVAWNAAAREWLVIDPAAHALHVFSADGTSRRSIGTRGSAPGEFNFPSGVAQAESLGMIIADAMNFRVQVIDAGGRPVCQFGHKGDAAGDFALPRDVAVDSEGHIYVLDNQFENVQIFDGQGGLLMALGQEGSGPGEFALPSGITIDAQDRIWIADTYNRRVQVFQYLREAGA